VTAGRVLLAKVAQVLEKGTSFVMESTISGSYHLRVLREAREKGYKIHLIYVFLKSHESNVARVKHRVHLGGHNVPETDIIRRYHKSIRNFEPTIALADAWRLYYNGSDGHQLIATSRDNYVEILHDELYQKFKTELEVPKNAYKG